MTHNELLRRVVKAHMDRMNIQQSLKALQCYMMEDYGGCDMEELEDFYKKHTSK
jgi:hypothetical protein